MTKLRPVLLILFLIMGVISVRAIDLWQYPEMADRHSIFVGGFFSSVTFTDSIDDLFSIYYPETYADYLLPFGFPVSIGASVSAIDPDEKNFGGRLSYHINFDVENLDVYIMYTVNYFSSEESRSIEYGGRAGVRWLFGQFVCVTIETGHKLKTINFGVSIKLN